jgi:hypothetical protein
MASIKYPSKFDEQVKLFKLIYEKHLADGDKSPLADYDLKGCNTRTGTAMESDKKAKEYTRMSEELTRERNLAFDTVTENMRAMGALLKAKYRDNPKELGKWGFTVTGE